MEYVDVSCSKCADMVHPLSIFPRGICLACYEREHDQDTPAQDYATIMQVFGGK